MFSCQVKPDKSPLGSLFFRVSRFNASPVPWDWLEVLQGEGDLRASVKCRRAVGKTLLNSQNEFLTTIQIRLFREHWKTHFPALFNFLNYSPLGLLPTHMQGMLDSHEHNPKELQNSWGWKGARFSSLIHPVKHSQPEQVVQLCIQLDFECFYTQRASKTHCIAILSNSSQMSWELNQLWGDWT